MTVWLLRHGMTACNAEGRYQGRLDVPLSPEGAKALRAAEFAPETVYVSPLRRAVQTAQILFPTSDLETVEDLAEIDFGDFDGRTADEMAGDPAYRAWVERLPRLGGAGLQHPLPERGDARRVLQPELPRFRRPCGADCRGRAGKPCHCRARRDPARRDGALFRTALRVFLSSDALRRGLCARI